MHTAPLQHFHPLYPGNMTSAGIMHEEEILVLIKKKEFENKMRKFNPEDITRDDLGNFDAKMTSFENEAENLIMSIIKLLVYNELSQERVQHWQAQQETLERNIKVYRRCMVKHAHELRITQNQVDNQMVDNKNFANFMADSNAVRVESLRIKISEKSQQKIECNKVDVVCEALKTIETKEPAASLEAPVDSEELVKEVGVKKCKVEPDLSGSRAIKDAEYWKEVTQERNIKDYRRHMEKQASDLRKALNQIQNQNVRNF